MTRGVFITGTDTGIGKTHAATALIRALVAQGHRVAAMKPVLTGVDEVSDDAALLRAASNVAAPAPIVNPYAFAPAIAPHVAARRAGVEIDLCRIEAAYRTLGDVADIVVIEGAGGALVPLNAHTDMLDIALTLRVPAILVVGVRLGCINHALLSVLAIRARGIALAGWIANTVDPAMEEREASIETLERAIAAPLIARMDWGERDLSPAAVAICATALR